jgi:hypothetical protein
MYNGWGKDLKDSVRALEKIKDGPLKKLISGKIHTIESKKDSVLIMLDMKSGIDYIREDETGLQGIAARCQWCGNKKPFNSFTVRASRHTGSETEFNKRRKQIADGYFYPTFTMQAYFDNREENNLLSAAMTRTLDLYNFIEKQPGMVVEKKSDNIFCVVYWRNIENLIKSIYMP